MKTWLPRIAVLLLATFLVGCTGWGLTPEEEAQLTPQQKFYKLQGELIAAFEPAVVYTQRSGGPCTEEVKVNCYKPEIAKILLELKREADAALDTAARIVFGDSTLDQTTNAVLIASTIAARIITRVQLELVRAKVYDSKREWFYWEALTHG